MINKTLVNRILRLLAAVMAITAVVSVLLNIHRDLYRRAMKIKASGAAEKMMSSCEGYNIRKAINSTIYYTDTDKEYALLTERIINTYLPLLCADFELDELPYAVLIIYPGEKEMYGAIGYNAKSRREAPMPMGAYSAGILTMLSPSRWIGSVLKNGSTEADAFISNGPVIHELTHLILDKKTDGNYMEWFSEGVALFYENKYTGCGDKLSPVLSEPVSYKELSRGFKYIDQSESYRKSHEIIKYIEDCGGEAMLKKIYLRLNRGEDLDSVLRTELAEKYMVLDNL